MCLVLAVAPPESSISSKRLASFYELPPAYLAKHLQALSAAGITEALLGRTGGYRLARDPRSISFLDIVDAIESDEPWFRCAEIRQCGPTAQPSSMYPSACDIASTIWSAERAWKNHLDSVNAVHSVGRTHCCCWSSPTRGDTGMAEVGNRWHTSGLTRPHQLSTNPTDWMSFCGRLLDPEVPADATTRPARASLRSRRLCRLCRR